jgi:glucose-1-phosphate cytidylyltransferase
MTSTAERSIKAVILAGGCGMRLSEETSNKPKPMVEVGGRPILGHIMKSYAQAGIRDFIICLGYKGALIKEYFFNSALHASDVTIDLRSGITVHKSEAEDWRITLVDTGLETQTGGRLRRIRSYLGDDELFCMTYGDAVADIYVSAEMAFHRRHGKRATVAAVSPLARFGALHLDGDTVDRFEEKPSGEGGLIRGGFFVLSPSASDLGRTTECCGCTSPCRPWRGPASCRHTGMTDSGSSWTRCATSITSSNCAKAATPHGTSGGTRQ